MPLLLWVVPDHSVLSVVCLSAVAADDAADAGVDVVAAAGC